MAHIYQIKEGVLPYAGALLKSKKGPGEEFIIGHVEHPKAKTQNYSYSRSELHYKGRDTPPPMSDEEFVSNYRKYMTDKEVLTDAEILAMKGDSRSKMVSYLREKVDEDKRAKLIIG